MAIRRRKDRKPRSYEEHEFEGVELEPVEKMSPQYKEDLCQMWSEIHFGILEDS